MIRSVYTLFFIRTISSVYKNNEAQIWPKIRNNVRTIQAGIWKHRCKVCLSYNKILLFSLNSTVLSVELLQMLRSIEYPLGFIGLDQLMITSKVYYYPCIFVF